MRRLFVLFATLVLAVTAVCATPVSESTSNASSVVVKDMIGREVEVVPGSYTRVVCIGAGALRMYSVSGRTSGYRAICPLFSRSCHVP